MHLGALSVVPVPSILNLLINAAKKEVLKLLSKMRICRNWNNGDYKKKDYLQNSFDYAEIIVFVTTLFQITSIFEQLE